MSETLLSVQPGLIALSRNALSDKGALSKTISEFSPRKEQIDMCVEVATSIQEKNTLIVEAGTGVGKTFAYLVPALLSGGTVIVSTATKNLQEQLFNKDLPLLIKALGLAVKVALLKGRNNYLCPYRLQQTLAHGRLPDAQAARDLAKIQRWWEKSVDGDLSAVKSLSEDASIKPLVTSTTDNCLGQDCPEVESCPVLKAREKARNAQVVIVNHHLLFADLVLKEDGFGELLPEPDTIIVDEAHNLVDTAYQFYGQSLSSRMIADLCKEVELAYRTQVPDCRELLLSAQRCDKASRDFRLCLPDYDTRQAWGHSLSKQEEFLNLSQYINELAELLKVNSSRTKELELLFARACSARQLLGELQSDEGDYHKVSWFETFRSGFRLSSTPLEVSQLFEQSRSRYANAAWILTSATLSVNNSFRHFQQALAWHSAKCLTLPSSFDYAKNALLYVPRMSNSVNSKGHTKEVVECILPLLYQTGGRALLLFTSHRALQQAANECEDNTDFTWLVQGKLGKSQIIKAFSEEPRAVILATGSFWEGVDLAGNQLVLVVIDKLPFAAPDDPLLKARVDNCRQQGENPFLSIQLPQAILSLKQGVGRLIRRHSDRGIICICDGRLVGKSYANDFLTSLPPLARTRDIMRVETFIKTLSEIH